MNMAAEYVLIVSILSYMESGMATDGTLNIFPQEQCLRRGSIGGVECTLNGSSLSSTVHVEVHVDGLPIPQSGYRNSFPVPHRTIGLNVLTLVQPFMSTDLPAAFSLLCVAYDSSGLSVSPLQLSSESTVHIEDGSASDSTLSEVVPTTAADAVLSESPTTTVTDSVPYPGNFNVAVVVVVTVVVVVAVVAGFLIAGYGVCMARKTLAQSCNS